MKGKRMKAKKENKLYWRRLDNSAKIFPISAGKKYSTVFRLSCQLFYSIGLYDLKFIKRLKSETIRINFLPASLFHFSSYSTSNSARATSPIRSTYS